MANEATLTSKVVFMKGSAYGTSVPSQTSFTDTVVGVNMGNNTQNIGTTVEEIVLGDINAGSNQLGWFWVKNMSTTDAVEVSYGDATSTNFADRIITRLPPGMPLGPIKCPPSRTKIYGKAVTVAVDIMWAASQA